MGSVVGIATFFFEFYRTQLGIFFEINLSVLHTLLVTTVCHGIGCFWIWLWQCNGDLLWKEDIEAGQVVSSSASGSWYSPMVGWRGIRNNFGVNFLVCEHAFAADNWPSLSLTHTFQSLPPPSLDWVHQGPVRERGERPIIRIILTWMGKERIQVI